MTTAKHQSPPRFPFCHAPDFHPAAGPKVVDLDEPAAHTRFDPDRQAALAVIPVRGFDGSDVISSSVATTTPAGRKCSAGSPSTLTHKRPEPNDNLQKAEQLGGQTVVPPTALEQFGLTVAFCADPEGHVIGLSKGAVQ